MGRAPALVLHWVAALAQAALAAALALEGLAQAALGLVAPARSSPGLKELGRQGSLATLVSNE